MKEQFYFMRFVAHRTTFAQDMSDDERETMRRHVAYWAAQLRSGTVLMFGPVSDPRESWGFGIFRVASEGEALALTANDPAKAIGRHEVLPLPNLIRA